MNPFPLPALLGIFLTLCPGLTLSSAQTQPTPAPLPAIKRHPATAPQLPTPLRAWKTIEGQSIVAKVIEINQAQATAVLEQPDGKRLAGIPLARLSDADQTYLSPFHPSAAAAPDAAGAAPDKEMLMALKQARLTFPAAYRDIKADQERAIRLFTGTYIKAAFSDLPEQSAAAPEVEHLMLREFSYDGKEITAVIPKNPQKLKTLKEGDTVKFPLARLTDWGYTTNNQITGGFTERLLHSRMSPAEKTNHNTETGINWDNE